MLEFGRDYFKEEVRSGFTVPEMMKRVWAVEMTVLSEIDRICKEYNFTYWISWGTLLGAVRHKGYVPWDDDIDIIMPRGDYHRLLGVLSDELPEGYVVRSPYHNPDHNQPLTAVLNTEYIITDPERRAEFFDCPYICGIDIIPLDYVPADEELASLQRNLYSMVFDFAQQYEKYKSEGLADGYIAQIEDILRCKIERNGREANQLWMLLDKVGGLFDESECDRITCLQSNICYNENYYYKKEWFAETVELPFEGMMLPAPGGYDELLKYIYGDYMIPVQNVAAHDYPFYKVQQEYMDRQGIT